MASMVKEFTSLKEFYLPLGNRKPSADSYHYRDQVPWFFSRPQNQSVCSNSSDDRQLNSDLAHINLKRLKPYKLKKKIGTRVESGEGKSRNEAYGDGVGAEKERAKSAFRDYRRQFGNMSIIHIQKKLATPVLSQFVSRPLSHHHSAPRTRPDSRWHRNVHLQNNSSIVSIKERLESKKETLEQRKTRLYEFIREAQQSNNQSIQGGTKATYDEIMKRTEEKISRDPLHQYFRSNTNQNMRQIKLRKGSSMISTKSILQGEQEQPLSSLKVSLAACLGKEEGVPLEQGNPMIFLKKQGQIKQRIREMKRIYDSPQKKALAKEARSRPAVKVLENFHTEYS